MELIERRYAQVVTEALAYHEAQPPLQAPQPKRRGHQKRRPRRNLALRLRGCRESVLRFLHEPAIPFTNNLAGQDMRMRKVRQKISGGFRSKQGHRILPRCATCCRVRASKAATAARPCGNGPRSSSPHSLPNGRAALPRPDRLEARPSPLPFSQPRAGQPAYLGSYIIWHNSDFREQNRILYGASMDFPHG